MQIRLLTRMAAVFGLSLSFTSVAAGQASPDNELQAMADRYMEAILKQRQPIAYFSNLTLERHDRFIDNTDAGRVTFSTIENELLVSLQAIDPGELKDAGAAVFHAKFTEALETSIDQRICRQELWDINHMFGAHAVLLFLVDVQPLSSEQDLSDALKRWRDAARYYRDEVRHLQSGLAQGYSAPKRVVERVITQLTSLSALPTEQHPFMRLVERSDNSQFAATFQEVLQEQLLPAMATYTVYLEKEYLPRARSELGLHAIPDGRACYMAHYRQNTSLKRTPEQVFELGMKTVNANKAKVTELGRQLYGTQTFEATLAAANADPSQQFADADSLHDFFVAVVDRARNAMPDYFEVMPSIKMIVEPAPAYQQGTGLGAHYVMGASDRDARFIYDPTTYRNENHGTAEIVSLHEGYPGHHMQIALVQEQTRFHPLEGTFSNDAYAEGWARYAERLAEEAGLYQSSSALVIRRAWPARGMVADPALHLLGWNNEEVSAFLQESGHPAIVGDLDAILDRMAALPAQLTAYDSGGLEIIALRDMMQQAQGKNFDIKAFHRLILENGNVSMVALRSRLEQALSDK